MANNMWTLAMILDTSTGTTTEPAALANDLGVQAPVSAVEIFYMIVVYVAGTLAAAAGVGGGAIYTPLYMILFSLLYEAVPLSKAAVCGSALAFFVFNVSTPVPWSLTKFPTRFAYDVIMVMEPATLLGTTFGVLGSRVVPMWLITVMMASLLAASAFKTFSKAKRIKSTEAWLSSEAQKNSKQEEESATTTLLHQYGNEKEPKSTHNDELAPSLTSTPKLNGSTRTYGTSNQVLPVVKTVRMPEGVLGYEDWLGWRTMLSVGVCFFAVMVCLTLTNDALAPPSLAVLCGSIGFWELLLLSTVVCSVVTILNVRYLITNAEALHGRCAVEWNAQNGVKYSLMCLSAGFLSALCGVGGSTIKGPILLEMGLHPTLAKASAQLMLLSTVASSTLQFALSDQLPPRYATVFFVLGTLSGFSGKYLIDVYVKRNRRQSTIVYLLAWYIVFAAVSMTTIGVLLVVGQWQSSADQGQFGFRGVCDAIPDDSKAFAWLTPNTNNAVVLP